jgi:hypothetical protein
MLKLAGIAVDTFALAALVMKAKQSMISKSSPYLPAKFGKRFEGSTWCSMRTHLSLHPLTNIVKVPMQ